MNIGKGNVGLTLSSIRYFGADNDKIIVQGVEVGKGSWFRYYWDHPFHATRISCRLGVVSIGLGIVSLLIGIAAFFA